LLFKFNKILADTFGLGDFSEDGAFLMRGWEKVREFSLTALAYNLRRVLNIVELPKLIAALPAKSQA
jgi:hypothetical protein